MMASAQRPEVVVIGAGISGLCAAYELTNNANEISPRVTVIDAAHRVGGNIQPLDFGSRVLDGGPDGVLARRPEFLQLCSELGIASDIVPIAARGAAVYARGVLRPLPDGLIMGIPTDTAALQASKILSRRGFLRVLRDRFAPVPSSRGALQDRAIGNLIGTKLGKEVVATLVDPMLGGINAGRVSEMSAAAVYPPLLAAAQERGSLMAALKAQLPTPGQDGADEETPAFQSLYSGLFSLATTLKDLLASRGVTFLLDTAITDVRYNPKVAPCWSVNSLETTTRADAVIVALPAARAAALLRDLDQELSALLSTIETASVAIITMEVSEGTLAFPETGTGVLVPPETPLPNGDFAGERFLMTALTFLDRKWPHLKKPGTFLFRVHMGRSDDERTLTMSDEELVARACEELRLLTGTPPDLLNVSVTRWPASLPQYQVNHLMRVAAIEQGAQRSPGLFVAGNSYTGIGVPACIASGRTAGSNARHLLTQGR